MSDKNPCPFCGDDSEYSRFIDLCAERANEIQRENELKIFINMCKSMDFVQVVRCEDCVHFGFFDDGEEKDYCGYWGSLAIEPDGFCKWGERREP